MSKGFKQEQVLLWFLRCRKMQISLLISEVFRKKISIFWRLQDPDYFESLSIVIINFYNYIGWPRY